MAAVLHPVPPAFLFLVVFIALAAAVLPRSALGQSGRWVDTDQTSVRLVSAVDAVGTSENLQFGLEFQLQPGWKIYWRSPGDAGFPPRPDWSASTNVASVDMEWPLPYRFQLFGMQTFGYKKEVVFPLTVYPERPGEPVSLKGSVEYLTCNEICIPYQAEVSLNLDQGVAAASTRSNLIGRYLSKVPRSSSAIGLRVVETAVEPREDEGFRLQVAVTDSEPLGKMDLFVEGPDGTYFDAPTVSYNADRTGAVLSTLGGGVSPDQLAALGAKLTIAVTGQSIETIVTPTVGPLQTVQTNSAAAGFVPLAILGFALLGGLILNLMPCVLPVLSLKLLSVMKHGGGDRKAVRAGFLASAAGIVSFFVLLGGGLAGLKAAGLTIGWGIQFQQPVFLAFMIAITTLFAANLFGVFAFSLPRFLADRAASASDREGLGGHFLTGGFVALMATPCSAPFLGTAVGFALSRGPVEILSVFLALGLGLAGPYLAVAAVPRIATMLPRPGPWMVKVKIVLGVALAGTAVWLATVLAAQVAMETVVAVVALAVMAAAVLAVYRLDGSRIGRYGAPLSAVLVVATIMVPVVRDETSAASKAASVQANWVVFDESKISEYVAEGKTVFVDVTADWCITCQFNKARVLNVDPVASLLAADGVVAMRADWTNPDPAIADFLQRNDRFGIPFNAIYGPSAPDGVILSELLTVSGIESALETAGPSLLASQ